MHGTQKPKTRGIPIYMIQVKEWQGFWGTRNKPRQHSGTHVSDGLQEIPLAHGSFDNDVDTMTRILNRTLGKNLSFPIEKLRRY